MAGGPNAGNRHDETIKSAGTNHLLGKKLLLDDLMGAKLC